MPSMPLQSPITSLPPYFNSLSSAASLPNFVLRFGEGGGEVHSKRTEVGLFCGMGSGDIGIQTRTVW